MGTSRFRVADLPETSVHGDGMKNTFAIESAATVMGEDKISSRRAVKKQGVILISSVESGGRDVARALLAASRINTRLLDARQLS